MNNRYKIYPELNFGVAKLESGFKTFEELYSIAMEMRKDSDFPKVYYQLNDLRGCTFNFDTSKISGITSLVEEYKQRDNQKLGVYLIDQPIETAYVQILFNSLKYERELCSTIEKAFDLLKLKISFKEFKNLIDI
ncbi:hypothetical protein ACFLSE_03785 [Bacteroidota bacterium]